MQNRLQFRESQTGVTMIEMLVVMTIMAILLAIGAPNMADWFRPNRLDAATNDLVAALNLARSEAIRRGASATVTQSDATNGVWESGWTIAAGGDTIRVAGSAAPLTIRARSSASVVTFDSRGTASAAGLFVVCNNGAIGGARAVIINGVGRVRVSNNGAAAPTDDSPAALTSCTAP